MSIHTQWLDPNHQTRELLTLRFNMSATYGPHRVDLPPRPLSIYNAYLFWSKSAEHLCPGNKKPAFNAFVVIIIIIVIGSLSRYSLGPHNLHSHCNCHDLHEETNNWLGFLVVLLLGW